MSYTAKNILVAWGVAVAGLLLIWLQTKMTGWPVWIFYATAVKTVVAGLVGTLLGLWLTRHNNQKSKK